MFGQPNSHLGFYEVLRRLDIFKQDVSDARLSTPASSWYESISLRSQKQRTDLLNPRSKIFDRMNSSPSLASVCLLVVACVELDPFDEVADVGGAMFCSFKSRLGSKRTSPEWFRGRVIPSIGLCRRLGAFPHRFLKFSNVPGQTKAY